MPAERQVPQWQHAVAGCAAGVATVLSLHPLDVVKTRMQVQESARLAATGAEPVYRGTAHALRTIVREEGVRALYAGLTPALLGSGLAWGSYFLIYDAAKKRHLAHRSPGDPPTRPPAWVHLASAAEAGIVVCLLTNPVWVVKTRLQLQRQGAQAAAGAGAGRAAGAAGVAAYRGVANCLTSIVREEGVRGLYKGLLPSLLLASHGAIQFAVYEELKSLAYAVKTRSPPHAADSKQARTFSSTPLFPTPPLPPAPATVLSPFEITACGALSKLAASVSTYPSQVLRARLQQRPDAALGARYSGAAHAMRATWAREGLRGFYRGLGPNVLRVMPQSAITLLVYETVLGWFNESAERSEG